MQLTAYQGYEGHGLILPLNVLLVTDLLFHGILYSHF